MAQGRSTKITSTIRWIRTSRLSIKTLSLGVSTCNPVTKNATMVRDVDGSGSCVRVLRVGFRVQGLGFRVYAFGFRVRVHGLWFMVRVWGLGFRVQGSGFRVKGFELRV